MFQKLTFENRLAVIEIIPVISGTVQILSIGSQETSQARSSSGKISVPYYKLLKGQRMYKRNLKQAGA